MILRFACSNYCSLRDQQVLNLTASSLEDYSRGLIECPASPSGTALPAVLIYGTNASGKSNFISAMDMMRILVLYSYTNWQPDKELSYHPFLLDDANSNAPSHFDADFAIEGVRYHYGFEVTNIAFESEWLYAIPNSRDRLLFEREGNQFHFGRELKGQNKTIAELTRPNSLFLSTAAQNNHRQLSKIFAYFKSIQGIQQFAKSGQMSSTQLRRYGLDPRVITFLEKIGTGVVGYKEEDLSFASGYPKFQKDLITSFRSISKYPINIGLAEVGKNIRLAHRGAHDKLGYFELEMESSGTRRLLIVLTEIFRALDEGSPIYIDELDACLHTHVGEALLKLFCSPEINRNGAQLIATTNDTNLMNSSLMRRDQVWFAEKRSDGATSLFPLSDFRTRSGDDIEKGYRQGRFGGVPTIQLNATSPSVEESDES